MDEIQNENEQHFAFLYGILQRFTGLSTENFQILVPYLQVRSFDKKTIIMPAGEMDDYLSLVVKGLVRKYITVDKKEITLQLATEGHIIQSEISFLTRTPSELTVESLEPSILVSMHVDKVHQALRDLPFAEELGRMIITYMFIKKDQRSYKQLSKNTRERFLDYVSEHPHMLQRVPQKILASYLNIKPETFSRLKHLVQKKEF